MISNKLLHFYKKSTFNTNLNLGNILEDSISFIQDTGEIYTHGKFYGVEIPGGTIVDASINNGKLVLTDSLENTIEYESITDLATTTSDGLMSKEDKTKLDGLESMDVNEKFRITLRTNQSINSPDIIGTTIKVTTIEENEVLFDGTWGGETIVVSVPVTREYKVELGDVENYATPSTTQTFLSRANGERNIEYVYDSCVVLVTLTSNQSNNNDISNAYATITYDSISQTCKSGQSVGVPLGKTVTVTFSDVTDYLTPSSQTFEATNITNSVTGTYNATFLIVNLTTNQANNDDISAANVTVTYGSTSKTATSGQIVKIPYNSVVTVTPSVVNHYSVAGFSFTANTPSKTETITYNTCVLTVNFSGNPADSTPTATVTYDSVSSTVSNGSGLKIPYGKSVTVTASAIDQYTTPSTVTFTADQPSKDVSMAYVYNPIKYSYVTLNQTITDPATMLSGDINGEAVQAIRANSHRVAGKKTAEGTITYCRLDDSNGTLFYDGTALPSTAGTIDMFLKLPVFYWQCVQQSTDVFKIGLAYGGNPGDGWKKWEGDKNLLGIYEGYVSSDNLYSWSGRTSTGSVSQANFKTYARNRGTGYHLITWEWHCIMALLYYCQYGHMNCQAQIGYGTESYTKTTGATNSLGMEDTVAGGNGDSNSINFWGLENWWGNKLEWVDNISISSRAWTVTDPITGTTRSIGTGPSSDNYISKMLLGEYFDLLPTAISGSSTTGYCDCYYPSTGNCVLLRSSGSSSTYGGVTYAGAGSDSSYTYTGYGSRLAFTGNVVESESVSAFKAL